VVYGLSEMVVKLFEVLFLHGLLDLRILKECVRDIVSSHPVEQELDMSRVVFAPGFFLLLIH
jgi:hypothetical protein